MYFDCLEHHPTAVFLKLPFSCHPCYSSSTAWELVGNAESQALPWTHKLELCFGKTSRGSVCTMKVEQNPWRASETECCLPPSVTGLGQGLKTCISQYPGGWGYWPQDCTGNHLSGLLVLSEAPGGLLSSTHTQAQRKVSRAGAQASASLLGDSPLHMPKVAKARPPAQ